MLPKNNRLTKKRDFDELFKKGKTIKSDFLFLKILKRGTGENRFGFIVSKKISKKSTVRNKIKRILRNAVAQEKKTFKNGFDAAILALPSSEKKNFSEIKQEVKALLNKFKA